MFTLSDSASKWVAVTDTEYDSIDAALCAAYEYSCKFRMRVFIFKYGAPFADVGAY